MAEMQTEHALDARERIQRELQSAPTQIDSTDPVRETSIAAVSSNESPRDASGRKLRSRGVHSDSKPKKRSSSLNKTRQPGMALRAPNTSLESLDMITKYLALVLATSGGIQLRREDQDITYFVGALHRHHRRFCAIEAGPTALSASKELTRTNETSRDLEYTARKLVEKIGIQLSTKLAPSLLASCFVPKSLPRSLSGNQKTGSTPKSPRGALDHRKRSQSESTKKGVVSASSTDQVVSNAVMSGIFKGQVARSPAAPKNEPPKTTAATSNAPGVLDLPKPTPMPLLPNKPSLIMHPPSRAESEPITRDGRSKSPFDEKLDETDRPLIASTRPINLPGINLPDMSAPEIVRRPFRRENSKNEGDAAHQQPSPPPFTSEAASTPPLPASPLLASMSPSSSLVTVSKPFKRVNQVASDSSSNGLPSPSSSYTTGAPAYGAHRGPKRHLKRSSSDAGRDEPKIAESIEWKAPTTARGQQPRRSELFEPVEYPSSSGSAYSLESRSNPLDRERPTGFASSNNIDRLDYQFADNYEFEGLTGDDDIDTDGGEEGNASDASASSAPNSARADGDVQTVDDGKHHLRPKRKVRKYKAASLHALTDEHLLTPSNTSAHCRFIFANLFSEFNFVFSATTWENQIWPAFQRLDSFILSHIVYGNTTSATGGSVSGASAGSGSKDSLAAAERSSSASNIIRAWSGPHIAASGSSSSLNVSSDSNGSKHSEKSKSPEKSRPISPKKDKSSKKDVHHDTEQEGSVSGKPGSVSAGRMMAVSEWSWGVFWILFRRYCSALIENATSDAGSNDSGDESAKVAGGSAGSTASTSLPVPYDDEAFTRLQSILRYNVTIHQQNDKCHEWSAQYNLDFDAIRVPIEVLAGPAHNPKAAPSSMPNTKLAELADRLSMPLVAKDVAASRYHDYFFKNYLSQKPLGKSIAQRLAMLHSNKYEAELKLANATHDSGFSWATTVDYDLVCLGYSYFSESKSRSCTIL